MFPTGIKAYMQDDEVLKIHIRSGVFFSKTPLLSLTTICADTQRTYASRNAVPPEMISKVILRHQDLKTTQIYLGKISDTDAIRWMDILHGR